MSEEKNYLIVVHAVYDIPVVIEAKDEEEAKMLMEKVEINTNYLTTMTWGDPVETNLMDGVEEPE